jgi:hypothetical protein
MKVYAKKIKKLYFNHVDKIFDCIKHEQKTNVRDLLSKFYKSEGEMLVYII